MPPARTHQGNVMTRFVALSGFLGAGKTTTLITAAKLLEKTGRQVAVVTNDQGTDLIDSTPEHQPGG